MVNWGNLEFEIWNSDGWTRSFDLFDFKGVEDGFVALAALAGGVFRIRNSEWGIRKDGNKVASVWKRISEVAAFVSEVALVGLRARLGVERFR